MNLLNVMFIVLCAWCVDCLLYHKKPTSTYVKEAYSQYFEIDPPLILTPYIESNRTVEVRYKAKVRHEDFLQVESFSGFFTVDKIYNSNLFFWFFPAEENYAKAPVMLWLQGGPGDSTFTGLFAEHGPFKISNQNTLILREERWTKKISMIYVDNPVGTGYSFTNEGGYCQNQTIIGEHLYSALQQFYQVFPELLNNEFFVAGESYGGKYGPAIAYTIHKNNPTASIKINLKGLALDSGYSDPRNMINYSDYLYQIGLIDSNVKNQMKILQNEYLSRIDNEKWMEASETFGQILGIFVTKSGMNSLYNYLYPTDPVNKLINDYSKYVRKIDIREALHVGNLTFDKANEAVYDHLTPDLPKSVALWIAELLNHYRLMTYNGMFDVIVAYPLTENYLQNLNFSGAEAYKNAKRKQWHVGRVLAGYVKQAGNLTEVLVRNGGHIIVHDRPKWCYYLINKFVNNDPIV